MKSKFIMLNAVLCIAFLVGAVTGFFVGLDIQQHREWDKGYSACLIQLMNYRNSDGHHIDIQKFIRKTEKENYQVADMQQ